MQVEKLDLQCEEMPRNAMRGNRLNDSSVSAHLRLHYSQVGDKVIREMAT